MQVARSAAGGEALMALNVDSSISAEMVKAVESEIGAVKVRSITLVG
jgi:D-3-phosphoglycerate dehydrogenase